MVSHRPAKSGSHRQSDDWRYNIFSSSRARFHMVLLKSAITVFFCLGAWLQSTWHIVLMSSVLAIWALSGDRRKIHKQLLSVLLKTVMRRKTRKKQQHRQFQSILRYRQTQKVSGISNSLSLSHIRTFKYENLFVLLFVSLCSFVQSYQLHIDTTL